MGKGNCYYSGSPLQYAFDERADKSVKVFSLTKSGVTDLRDIPLQSGRKLIRLESDAVEHAQSLLGAYPDALIEMKLLLTAPLTQAEAATLSEHENLVSLLTEVRTDASLQLHSRKGMTDEALFDAYFKASYNAEPSAEVKTLFLETLAEITDGE